MSNDTTRTGMPPAPASHDDEENRLAGSAMSNVAPSAESLLGEGKAQVKLTLDSVSAAVRDVATNLDGNGAAPLAKYVHAAADTVAGWANTVEHKSVDQLLGDTKTLIRTRPALAIGIAVAAGFAVSRFVRPR
ncbi:hypothetical protein KZX46_22450 (plasmid) [Polymorphobacter sp. PAMC 29334]|uniref:hypothetical protein n=1 Tax=Polymorphobacter sp. PAMC 29334 TaxID=2862331 RepID=UPI001C76CD69|nr:hypothetical protein [Polymorphobacter sp. PAMC 29334]QYE37147.1 hypothetical protein KZX46_22450 [Polymorphobacter sp. PAMC 29334]